MGVLSFCIYSWKKATWLKNTFSGKKKKKKNHTSRCCYLIKSGVSFHTSLIFPMVVYRPGKVPSGYTACFCEASEIAKPRGLFWGVLEGKRWPLSSQLSWLDQSSAPGPAKSTVTARFTVTAKSTASSWWGWSTQQPYSKPRSLFTMMAILIRAALVEGLNPKKRAQQRTAPEIEGQREMTISKIHE